MRRSSCRRLYWTTWKKMLRQMRHWWWVYMRLTVQVVTLDGVGALEIYGNHIGF